MDDGALSTEHPGDEPADVYLYNPLDPTPTIGGALCCYPGALQGGAWDQREAEVRADVLVYSTEPLTEDLEVTGPVRLVLYASSSAPDTDFTAKLVDVNDCGFARNLTEGIIRARFRESFAHEKMLAPGEVTEFTIDMWSTSNLFQKGHRDPARNQLQQLSTLRSQSEHRASTICGRGDAARDSDRDAQSRLRIAPGAAGDSRAAMNGGIDGITKHSRPRMGGSMGESQSRQSGGVICARRDPCQRRRKSALS